MIYDTKNLRPLLVLLAFALASCSDSTPNDGNNVNRLSRVESYAVANFDATYEPLSRSTASTGIYIGGPNDGAYSFSLPFDLPFDGDTIAAGTMISVGANGAVSLVNTQTIPGQQLVGDPLFPSLIGVFNGDIRQGSDKKQGLADTIGLYQTTGTAPNRVLTIEFPGFHLRGGGSGTGQVDTLAAAQIKLYETTGVIEFIYRESGLEMPSRLPIPPLVSIGLNGSAAPAFSSKLVLKDTKLIPVQDIRFTPGTE